MSVKARVWEYIMSGDRERMFCTREVLCMGSRSNIDNIMSTLVANDDIERLAWGLFRLSAKTLGYEPPPLSDEQIAAAKAAAFGHDAYQELADEDDAAELTRIVPASGCTSRFRRVKNRRQLYRWIELRNLADRKAALRLFRNGVQLYKIWRLGKSFYLFRKLWTEVSKLEIPMHETQKLISFLPQWLSHQIVMTLNRPARI